jgi:hypothetical protein
MDEVGKLARKHGVIHPDASDYEAHVTVVSHCIGPQPGLGSRPANPGPAPRPLGERFAKAGTEAAVADLWRTAVDRGEAAGALWGALSCRASTPELDQRLYEEVHMLSHQVERGRARRPEPDRQPGSGGVPVPGPDQAQRATLGERTGPSRGPHPPSGKSPGGGQGQGPGERELASTACTSWPRADIWPSWNGTLRKPRRVPSASPAMPAGRNPWRRAWPNSRGKTASWPKPCVRPTR